jgi:hypothetical protein
LAFPVTRSAGHRGREGTDVFGSPGARGADLIDGSGAPVIEDLMVVLEEVASFMLAPKRTGSRSAGAALAASGRTIVPGLIEAHTHAAFDADMRAYVKNGVTTIRFAGLDQGTVERLRKRIDRGELIGPRILSCGPMIDQPPPAYPEWSVAVGTPAEAAATAERLIRDHDLEALILTQRVTAPVMRASLSCPCARAAGCRSTWKT